VIRSYIKKLLKSSHTAVVGASSRLLPYVDLTALVAAKKLDSVWRVDHTSRCRPNR